MMKYVTLGVGVSFLATGVFAQDVEFNYGGQLRIRNEHKELSHSTQDKRNATGLRVRMELEAKVNNNLKFYIAPQATKAYGEVITEANDESLTNRNSSGDKYHSSMDLFEGYIESKTDGFKYKLGRQRLKYGDQRILGERNWTPGAASFDAFLVQWEIGKKGKLDLVYAQNSDGNSSSDESDDTNLAFAYYKLKMDSAHELDAYIIHNNEREVLESMTYGFRIKHVWGNFTFVTENMYQTQTDFVNNDDSVEHNVNIDLAYQLSSPLGLKLSYMQASAGYDQLYVNRHMYLGIIDIVGRKNLEAISLVGKYQTDSAWTFNAQLHMFNRKDENVAAYNQATSSTIAGDMDEKHIGNELDLIVDYEKNEYEKFRLGLSQFQHGDYFNDSLDNSSFVFLQYLFKM